MNNSIKFKEYMALMADVFGKDISSPLSSVYWEILKPYSDDQCETAFKNALSELKFFPKPAELLEIITGGKELLEDRATVQAGKVLESIKRVGGYETVDFEDQVTKAVIQQGFGGWDKLCSELKSDQEGWFLKDFVRIYKAYSREGITVVGALPGRNEIKNNAIGHDVKNEITQIGETFKKMIAE